VNKSENFKKRLRIGVIPIIATMFLVSIGSVGDQQAIAYEGIIEKNEYIDFQKYTGNRLLVFNDTRVDYCITDNVQNPAFNDIAFNAVKNMA